MVRKKISSSKEFPERYEVLYEEGPKVKYKNPEAWLRTLENSNRKKRLSP